MIEFTFTKEQISQLHNAKCDLYHTIAHLAGSLHPDIVSRFNKAYAAIDALLEPVYALEKEMIEAADKKIDAFRDTHPGKLRYSVWSMDETDFSKILINPDVGDPDAMIYEGRRVELPRNATYGDFWLAAEELIRQCYMENDGWDHIFIEGFRMISYRNELIIELHTGS